MKKNKIKIIIVILLLILLIYIFSNYIRKVMYPKKYTEIVIKCSEMYEIDENLIYSIIKTESDFNKNSKSSSGAIGLMQLMPKTAEEQASKIGIEYNDDILYIPECNIEIGVAYFSNLIKYFENNYILAIMAYNAGIGNVEKWINDAIINKDSIKIENIPFKETNIYVRKVLNNYDIYKKIN